jgi:CubicO group peptidase (beta-lactamase class C family)
MTSRRDLLKSALAAPLVFGLTSRTSQAQKTASVTQSPWLRDIAKQLQSEFHLPAVWVACNIEDEVEAAVVGVRKMGDRAIASLDDKLTVASISKPMAGLWIATLVEQGLLSYDTTVLEALPELKSSCRPEHESITLGQLLTHTAGVIRDVERLEDNLKLDKYPRDRLRQAREVLSLPSPDNSKGKELYSNNGVTLAATMAERLARGAFETLAGEFYRKQLGLKSWGVWSMTLKDDLSLPWPHSMKNNNLIPNPPKSVQHHFVRPSGGSHCTISDLTRFGLIATNATEISKSILKPETWASLAAPVPNSITSRCSFRYSADRGSCWHAGSLATTSSNLLVIPDWKVSIAVHTNATADDFRERGIALIEFEIRKRRAKLQPPKPCRIKITEVATVDETWREVIVPKISDDKVRIRVRFFIEAQERTGDLLTTVKLEQVEQTDSRLRGLAAGHHVLHFQFDRPKARFSKAIIKVDALGTAGNQTPDAAVIETEIRLD